jgi:hypothetical protein
VAAVARYGLGIDPGIHGAIGAAYERDDGRLCADVFDMPTAAAIVSGKRRDRVDPHALDALLAGLAMGAPGLALQEEVWARPIRKLTPKGIVKISRDPGTMLQLGMAAGIALPAARFRAPMASEEARRQGGSRLARGLCVAATGKVIPCEALLSRSLICRTGATYPPGGLRFAALRAHTILHTRR